MLMLQPAKTIPNIENVHLIVKFLKDVGHNGYI